MDARRRGQDENGDVLLANARKTSDRSTREQRPAASVGRWYVWSRCIAATAAILPVYEVEGSSDPHVALGMIDTDSGVLPGSAQRPSKSGMAER